jgi:AraC-like DNA-binding protein
MNRLDIHSKEPEFASAAMVRVLMRGLHELGLPAFEWESKQSHCDNRATVDLDLKRSIIQHAIRHGGLSCLIHLGKGIHHYANEPTHLAFLGAQTPTGLIHRWQRLERYIHSMHRIKMTDANDRSFLIHHQGVRNDVLPSIHESLVVCGVIAAMMQAQGVCGIRILVAGTEIYPMVSDAQIHAFPVIDAERVWHFYWADHVPVVFRYPHTTCVNALFPDHQWPPLIQPLAEYLLSHMMEAPSIQQAAQYLQISSRTLQRELTRNGLPFTEVVASCRNRVAAMLLLHSNQPLAEIGFLCGYSDQAHFTREFKKHVGLPPLKYRVAFAHNADQPALPLGAR